MMTCREAEGSLDDLVDGSLPLLKRQALVNHVEECVTCKRALKYVRCTKRLLRRLPRERMPDPMKNSLLDELRKSRSLPDPTRATPQSRHPPHSAHHAATDDDQRSTPGLPVAL